MCLMINKKIKKNDFQDLITVCLKSVEVFVCQQFKSFNEFVVNFVDGFNHKTIKYRKFNI